jgi:uncharacterized protein (DUF2235 family)
MKRIITCSDGTWDKPELDEAGQLIQSNVQKIFQLIDKTDARNGIPQIKFYDEGVGTEGSEIEKIIQGAIGAGLDEKILDAYKFIVWNFEPGDELYLFGFSRGAYTARSLAGLIRCCGIVKSYDLMLINQAFAIYRNRDTNTADNDAAVAFKSKYSYITNIRLVGVWDTVGALGIPTDKVFSFLNDKYKFHDVTLSSTIDNAFQALAIDEHRKQFTPSVWTQSPNTNQYNPDQKLEQVWFAGAHSDIGGGYAETGLSDIALLWMIEKATGTGLSIQKPDNLKPDYKSIIHDSSTGAFLLDKFDPYYRPIVLGDDASKATLSPSATQRMKDPGCDYTPENKITTVNQIK